MAVADLTIAITAAVFAAAALIFAGVQTISALAQFLASSNRCGRRITGAFDLRAGIWFSANTMTANPRYRMPVLTWSALRTRVPVMGSDRTYSDDFHPGRNFDQKINRYVDGKITRIRSRDGLSSGALHKPKTILHYLAAILWAPIGGILTFIMWLLCCPCCTCCVLCGSEEDAADGDGKEDKGCFGCGSDVTSMCTKSIGLWLVLGPFENAKHHKSHMGIDIATLESQTPKLEAGCWVQFLMSHQRMWWGHADLRWEWRLASLIPADVYGAGMETTTADLELMAALAGMSFSSDENILASTPCGEQISVSQHGSLGRMAYYRSNRENLHSGITTPSPDSSSPWANYCIDACRTGQPNHFSTAPRYSGVPFDGPSTAQNLDAVLSQLSRQRTEFDAQLPYSCGSAMWIFDSNGFKAALQDIRAILPAPWLIRRVGVAWGPLGEGINSCSCNRCCEEWKPRAKCSPRNADNRNPAQEKANSDVDDVQDFMSNLNPNGLQWPALRISHSRGDGSPSVCSGSGTLWTKYEGEDLSLINGSKVDIEISTLCASFCASNSCKCGYTARLTNFSTEQHDDDKVLAVVSTNTRWLSKVGHEDLTKAAEFLLLLDNQQYSRRIKRIATIMAYTECLLLKVRRRIGTTNMWNAASCPSLTDFSPIVFGA